jgi:hypothetical protein
LQGSIPDSRAFQKASAEALQTKRSCSRSATTQAFHEAQRQVKKGPCNLVSTHIPPSFCSIFTSLFLPSSLLFTQMKELYTNILDVEDTIQMKNYTLIYHQRILTKTFLKMVPV